MFAETDLLNKHPNRCGMSQLKMRLPHGGVFLCAKLLYIRKMCVCSACMVIPLLLAEKKHISVTAGPADGGAGDEQSTTAAASGIGRSLSVCAWIRELRKLWGSVLLLYVVDQVYYTVYGIEGDGKIRQLADWSIKC